VGSRAPIVNSSSLGEQQIATQTKNASWNLRHHDREDVHQTVHVELCEELGPYYRERIGDALTTSEFWTTDEYRTLVRCVDRVSKRMKRAKRHPSLDRLKETQNFDYPDQAMSGGAVIVGDTLQLAIKLGQLNDKEVKMLDLLRQELPQEQIWAQLGMGRSRFYEFKKRVFGKLASQFHDDT
jgi:hypothetical protein